MSLSNIKNIYEKMLKINQMSTEFWQRMALLSTASAVGFEKRAKRINSYYGETISDELASLSQNCNFIDINKASMNVVTKCTGEGFRELRNAEQVVIVTQDELWCWADLFLNAWLNLAYSLNPKAITN